MEKLEEASANLTDWRKELLNKQRFIDQVSFPEAVPGSCRICGSARKGPYLDTGHLEEFYGSVYYCNECFAEMARIMGYTTDIELNSFKEYAASLEEDNARLRETIEGYGKIFDGVASVNGAPVFNPPISPLSLDSEQTSEHPSTGKENLGDGARKIVKSKHDENVGIVHPTID